MDSRSGRAPSPILDAPMKIAVFNVKYSPNLGDGAIAECLEATLRQVAPHVSVVSIDLAGRTAWVTPGRGGRRAAALSALRRLPKFARGLVTEAVLGWMVRRRLSPQWRRELAGVDCCVIGGGQLIQETDLNFPLKLAGAAAIFAGARLPFAVHAVGVSNCRSGRALRLFERVWGLPDLVWMSARDDVSRTRLARMAGRDVGLAGDPALLAAKVWPAPKRPASARPRVGLSVAHASILNHHSGGDVGVDELADLFVGLIRQFAAAGYETQCFTNGAAEDELMLDAVVQRASAVGLAPKREPRRATPKELATMIAGFDIVVGHRLHAHILAYAYGVPSIGLKWDEKLAGFFRSVDRSSWLVPLDANDRGVVARLVGRGLAEGVEPTRRSAVINAAEDSVTALAEVLATACAARSRSGVPSADSPTSVAAASLGMAGTAS